MASLIAENLTVIADGKSLITDVNLTLKPRELVAVLGPNGAGKTTLLRSLLGMTQLDAGLVSLDDSDIGKLTSMERARRIAYLPQRRPMAWPNTVKDVVALGRFSHGAIIGQLSQQDQDAVDHALDSCALMPLVERKVDSLSGGEFARVHFARALAANAALLVADEPVAELDPHHQLRIATLIRQFVNDGGGALVVLHEIALAAKIADRLIWMHEGKIVADGPPQDTLTADRMREVYQVDARVVTDASGIDVRIENAL